MSKRNTATKSQKSKDIKAVEFVVDNCGIRFGSGEIRERLLRAFLEPDAFPDGFGPCERNQTLAAAKEMLKLELLKYGVESDELVDAWLPASDLLLEQAPESEMAVGLQIGLRIGFLLGQMGRRLDEQTIAKENKRLAGLRKKQQDKKHATFIKVLGEFREIIFADPGGDIPSREELCLKIANRLDLSVRTVQGHLPKVRKSLTPITHESLAAISQRLQ